MEFKDKRGAHKTESLFIETIQPQVFKKYDPIFITKNYFLKNMDRLIKNIPNNDIQFDSDKLLDACPFKPE